MNKTTELLLRSHLQSLCKLLSVKQYNFLNRIYREFGGVKGIPVRYLETAIGLCERTIEKNSVEDIQIAEVVDE